MQKPGIPNRIGADKWVITCPAPAFAEFERHSQVCCFGWSFAILLPAPFLNRHCHRSTKAEI